MNLTDIILIVILAAIAAFAVRSIIKRRGSCGGNCSGCKHFEGKCQKKE